MTLSLFRSRWSTPQLCAKWTPLQTCMRVRMFQSRASRTPYRSRSASSSCITSDQAAPPMRRRTICGRPAASISMSWTGTMFGCSSPPVTHASRRIPSAPSPSRSLAFVVLTATSRPSASWRPARTTLMPPSPIISPISSRCVGATFSTRATARRPRSSRTVDGSTVVRSFRSCANSVALTVAIHCRGASGMVTLTSSSSSLTDSRGSTAAGRARLRWRELRSRRSDAGPGAGGECCRQASNI